MSRTKGDKKPKVEEVKISIAVEESKGRDLTEALQVDDFEHEHTIVVKIGKTGAPVVTMAGFWNGQLLRAALKSIENQYGKIRRHGAIWAMKKAQENKAA